MYKIGKNLVKVREELNITQQQMADRVGFSRATLSSLENDRTHILNEKFVQFAEANNIPPGELVLGYKPNESHQTLEQVRAEYGMERESLVAEYEARISALETRIDELRQQNAALLLQIDDLRDHLKTKDEIINHLRNQIPRED